MPVLPNFFVVGAGKAGTTSLYRYLRQHPQIYMSPIKEPSYFASEVRVERLSEPFARHVRRQSRRAGLGNSTGWLAQDWEEYVELFAGAKDEKAVGEATPSYLWSKTAAGNIRARIPRARIVMVLRDPAERAYSQYLHQLAEGLTRYTFREQIERGARGGEQQFSILYPFLEVGLYYEQVKRYLDIFPRERVRIYWYERDWRQPRRLLADLFAFLDVDCSFEPDISERLLARRAPRLPAVKYLLKKYEIWPAAKGLLPPALRPALRRLAFRRGAPPPMERKDREFLIGYYREDIRKLAALLDRDLGAWLR